MEGFGGLKMRTDIERVLLTLMLQGRFTLFEGRMEERITIGSKNNLVRIEVKRDGADMLSWDGETIDDAISDVLVAHGFNHVGNDEGPGRIVAAKFVDSLTLSQLSANLVGTHGSQFSLVRFGIVIIKR